MFAAVLSTVLSMSRIDRSSVHTARIDHSSPGLNVHTAMGQTDRAGSIDPSYAMQSPDATSSASSSEPVG